jgi:hypothetical protein
MGFLLSADSRHDLDLFSDRTRTVAGPLDEYTVGRFTFKLPKGYTPEASRFYLTPIQEMTAD